MLEKPPLDETRIIDDLQEQYGLSVSEVTFLPLGADVNTAVYRAEGGTGTRCFVKLRRGAFDEMTVIVPKMLHNQGVKQVIPPLETQTHGLWASLDEYKLMVFPFVEGHSGWEIPLKDQHWMEFGKALKCVHQAILPQAVLDRLPRETFSPYWRERVREFMRQVEAQVYDEATAAQLADFLKSKKGEINQIVNRAEQLAAEVERQSLPFILCHADIHVGNLLIDAHDTLHVVDWDTLTLTPKERDLMFIGGGLGSGSHSPEDEVRLFYEGYGKTEINRTALAYYRYERIVQDIVAYCEQLLLTDEGGDDRPEGLRQLMGQFLPGEVVELAYQTDQNSLTSVSIM
jgi:spectinomycin phosphotransferase